MSNEFDINDNVAPLDGGVASYRSLPQNLEAEQALLGAILVNNDALNKVADFLRGEHFHEPVHERIFDAASKLIDRGQIANPVTLKHYFDKDEALSEVGGASYLARLAGSAVTVINAQHYGHTIYDLALKRSLIVLGEEMVNDAYDPDIDRAATEQLEDAEQALFDLAETGAIEGGFRPFSFAASEAVRMAEAAKKRSGHVAGVATYLTDLDRKLGGLHPSDLIILAARPAMGKTALATNIAYSAALHYARAKAEGREGEDEDGAVVGFFSLEMSAEQLATRILAEQVSISSDKIRRGEIDQDAFSAVAAKSAELASLPLFIDDTPALTISALRTRARRLKRTEGLGLIVVDYLQLLRSSNTRVENRVQEISEITRGLKALAKELHLPVLALAQLSRAVEQREDKRPHLADLRESGSIEQDADVVMFIYREEYYHERMEPSHDSAAHAEWMERGEKIHGIAEVIIGKQRHGPTGKVELQFQGEFTKFSNLERDHYDSSNFD